MTYSTISVKELHALRAERLRMLECDHARVALQLEEDPENESLQQALADIHRRILIHRSELKIQPEEPQSVGKDST